MCVRGLIRSKATYLIILKEISFTSWVSPLFIFKITSNISPGETGAKKKLVVCLKLTLDLGMNYEIFLPTPTKWKLEALAILDLSFEIFPLVSILSTDEELEGLFHASLIVCYIFFRITISGFNRLPIIYILYSLCCLNSRFTNISKRWSKKKFMMWSRGKVFTKF